MAALCFRVSSRISSCLLRFSSRCKRACSCRFGLVILDILKVFRQSFFILLQGLVSLFLSLRGGFVSLELVPYFICDARAARDVGTLLCGIGVSLRSLACVRLGTVGGFSRRGTARLSRSWFGLLCTILWIQREACLSVDSFVDQSKDQPIPASNEAADLEDGLLTSIKKASVSSAFPETASETLKLERKGGHVPQSAIFDLKTRSIRKKGVDTLGEELPRLWISQISIFVLAHHQAGVFRDIEIHDVRDTVKKWEEARQSDLAKFAILLQKIVTFAQSSEQGRLEITKEGGSALELREQCADAGRALPPHIVGKWRHIFGTAQDRPSRASPDPGVPQIVPLDFEDDRGSVGYPASLRMRRRGIAGLEDYSDSSGSEKNNPTCSTS